MGGCSKIRKKTAHFACAFAENPADQGVVKVRVVADFVAIVA